jgi:acyl-CoA dehydrogenase
MTPNLDASARLPDGIPLKLGPSSPVDQTALDQILQVARETTAENDAEAHFPAQVLNGLRATGLLGLTVPKEYGGLGGSVMDVLAVSHALARECMSSGMIFTMHAQQVEGICRHAGDALRDRLLPKIANGEVYLASVTTEPNKGGHLLTAAAALKAGQQSLIINRMAPVVTGGQYADGYLITMRESPDAASNRVSLVYASRDQVTATPLGHWDALGMRATSSVPMQITGQVPPDQLIGRPGEFREIVIQTFGPLAHIGWAACWLGTSAGALSRTVQLLRSPQVRQNRDVSSDLLRHRLSKVRARLDTVYALITRALHLYMGQTDGTTLDTPAAQLLFNALKITASEQCLEAVDSLVEIVGMRDGYLRSSTLGLERALRDLRSAPLNYSNDRLHAVDGAQVLLDHAVTFA